jgi:hypothetical protein
MTGKDSVADDDRARCVNCANFRERYCVDAVRAGLSKRRERVEVGTEFANMPQHCPAFQRWHLAPKK